MTVVPFSLTPPEKVKRRAKPFSLSAEVEAERKAQIGCTAMIRSVIREDVCFTAIDHGHSFNPTPGRNGVPIGLMEMAARKARGIEPGIPDYSFVAKSISYWIEYKVEGGKLNDNQKIFIRKLLRAGATVRVCWGDIQVMNTIYRWGLCRPQVKWEIR